MPHSMRGTTGNPSQTPVLSHFGGWASTGQAWHTSIPLCLQLAALHEAQPNVLLMHKCLSKLSSVKAS